MAALSVAGKHAAEVLNILPITTVPTSSMTAKSCNVIIHICRTVNVSRQTQALVTGMLKVQTMKFLIACCSMTH